MTTAISASGPSRRSAAQYWLWAVIVVSLPAVVPLAFLPLAKAPFEGVPSFLRAVVFFVFDVGLASKYFSASATCLALCGAVWKGVSWRTKLALVAIAAVSWPAAIHVTNVLTSCFGKASL